MTAFQKIQRQIASAAAALALSTIFIGAAIGGPVTVETGPAAARQVA